MSSCHRSNDPSSESHPDLDGIKLADFVQSWASLKNLKMVSILDGSPWITPLTKSYWL